MIALLGARSWSSLGTHRTDGLTVTLTYAPDPSMPGHGTLALHLGPHHAFTAKSVPESVLPKLIKCLPLIDVKRTIQALSLHER